MAIETTVRINPELSVNALTTDVGKSEKDVLEMEKLRQDLRHGKIGLYLSILGTALLLIGLGVDRVKALEQRRIESDLRARELRMAIFTEKKATYLALTDAACTIAGCRTYEDVEKASVEFNKLYYGRAHIIAEGDPTVFEAKVEFHKALVKYLAEKPSVSPENYFKQLAMAVTFACKPNIDPRTLN